MDNNDQTIDHLIEIKFGDLVESTVNQYITDIQAELEKALEYDHEDDIDEF